MNVRLISVTPEAEYEILYIARVSTNQESQDTRLIGYLIRNGHWSPFEHASMTLEIETSRAISAQICRHRSFTFQEFSQRYAEVEGTEKYRARRQGETNRQGSTDDLSEEVLQWFEDAQTRVEQFCLATYKTALEMKIAKECARFLMPISTKTRLYMTGTVRSWIHYLGDGPGGRTNEHTQQEHREIALAGQKIFVANFPVISKALGWIDAKT